MKTKQGMPSPNELVTEARLKEELNAVATAVENALNAFQRDLIGGQARSNLVWNTVNVVLGALLAKGLITEEDVKIHGESLWRATTENMKRTRRAITEKRPVRREELVPSPLDVVTEVMGHVHERLTKEAATGGANDMAQEEERKA